MAWYKKQSNKRRLDNTAGHRTSSHASHTDNIMTTLNPKAQSCDKRVWARRGFDASQMHTYVFCGSSNHMQSVIGRFDVHALEGVTNISTHYSSIQRAAVTHRPSKQSLGNIGCFFRLSKHQETQPKGHQEGQVNYWAAAEEIRWALSLIL